MERYNGILCATVEDLNGIISYNTLKMLVHRQKVERVKRGGYEGVALYSVDSLPLKYKTEVYHRYPDYEAQAESKHFIDMIQPDGKAQDFFNTYTLPNGRHLSAEKQTEYANNAAILNAFRELLAASDSRRLKSGKHAIPRGGFFVKAARILPYAADKFPNSLPENARRLQNKYKDYMKRGCEAFVSGNFGLRNSAKVTSEEQESLIVRLLADPRNLDNAQIAEIYNGIASDLKWKPITSRNIQFYKEKHDLVVSGGRLGETRFNNQKIMLIKRYRPSLPLYYWTTDGWTAEQMYQQEEVRGDRSLTTYTSRLTIVVVLDACINYPVGYAIGKRENPELIKEAVRNAMNHTAELFGTRYRVNQLQSDNYGRGAMKPLYQAVSDKYTPAKPKNAKAKVIEPYFKYLNKKYCQLMPNWSGFGITSDKNSQPNSEFLNKMRHSFPTEEECMAQLAKMIEKERVEKRGEYLRLFAELPEEHKLPLTQEQYLLLFGAETGHTNAIEAMGLRPTIGGIKRDYDCFDPKFREYAHVKWTVKYDPENLDNILAVNADGSLRFMLEKKHVQPMALLDRKEGDAEQLARVRNFNKELVSDVSRKLNKTYEKVEQLFNDNPQLDMATKLLLCDSEGQNKNNKSTKRLQAHEVEDNEAIPVTPVKPAVPEVEEDDTLSLY